MKLDYTKYLDQILGGWIGKSIGGTVGARFEGYKGWIDIKPEEMFPDEIPPNDDLDLQVLWLKVMEEKGPAATSDDLADAWIRQCWYPFCEYGIFRRNWRLGIHPPESGRFNNRFWTTGMGCPIRSEIWGYLFPGSPDLAAKYAAMDGMLDHDLGGQSVGAEKMFAAMASMAFFESDIVRLCSMFMHHLPAGSPIEQLALAAFQAHGQGLSLREARDRLLFLGGHPEVTDIRDNIPIIFLALLYGKGDMQETLLSALRCGYDTDSTMATLGAFIGQISGASGIPKKMKDPIGDVLVMGIEYSRKEMTLSALARDTARVGILMSQELGATTEFVGAPKLKPFPKGARVPATRLSVEYEGLPAAAPGDTVNVVVKIEGKVPADCTLNVSGQSGWKIVPNRVVLDGITREIPVSLHASSEMKKWSNRNLFSIEIDSSPRLEFSFGVAGAALWQFLGAYFQPLPNPDNPMEIHRQHHHHFVSMEEEFLPEPKADLEKLYHYWKRVLGREPVIPSYEDEIDVTSLVGLHGQYCAYLHRTIYSPEARGAYLLIGNNDGYRLFLNGRKVAEMDERSWWQPYNNIHKIDLKKGANHFFLKLLKRGDKMDFSMAIRYDEGFKRELGFIAVDFATDLSDKVPWY